ncbi:AMP phosphorylase [Candidatus Micrarchaeota archaeon CG_4_10_14_0_2_um_filter_60_11]|nr:MAG: AMP phosphorylase [Candidatus Micrarchaeota archaeon CG1_02_60_51]PIN95960.1 MAG: AMP phosphorylase [Candidatus Micrarchaeota archaeon CG10_big_fil_rev_8_21_14_0_10_60_32]PIO02291.1 MAG: AMP phosphorylase [Candidatus Micrarchaeota archaeon CG09_land_8_20_14_0_10_60_16]PIY91163.1 MAG: AMP phosphorylase [Candidatus Micrarchaeota archaeon CG_4_10_14_0_8_um_filter_60_7]PIZ91082.1 MAG: AMP phosphorylase [Candidatus Micrarchaeota archaeon CG_4_10_14_0_2_um_filter_60_11]
MEFRVQLFDVEQGQNEVVLNDSQARELSIGISDRVKMTANRKSVTAIVDLSHEFIRPGEVGVFSEVAQMLSLKQGQKVLLESAERPASLDAVRKKLDGGILDDKEIASIINDLMAEKLSATELAVFISAVYTRGMTTDETVSLTKAIYASGGSLKPKAKVVASEHSIGGVAGDRSSMLIVPIISSLGVCIPKTCSRAISSAAGTADVMEVFCPVSLDLKKMQRVVDKVNACLTWGGAVNMAAADDKMINIRKPLHLDPKPLLLCSILAKKKAEGADYVLLDLPIGRGAKLDNLEKARDLAKDFEALGRMLGMRVQCSITDGSEPLLRTIGPNLEARTVLETLQGKGSYELAEKACVMSGLMLSMLRGLTREEGYKMARHQLASGKALEKFLEIVREQGGNPDVKNADFGLGKYKQAVIAKESGKVGHVDNREISRVCRTLGAPADKAAGMVLKFMKGDKVEAGQVLLELYSGNKEKAAMAARQADKVVEIEKIMIDVV